jgi:SNF2 family DNA or RNA helicase
MKVSKPKEKNQLEITGISFRGENFTKLTSFPARRKFKDGRFLFFDDFLNIKYCVKNFPEANWEDDILELKERAISLIEEEKELLDSKGKINGEVEKYQNVFKTKPLKHQLECFNISKDLKSYALLFEQGCGKTKATIDTATYLYLAGKIDAIVIVAPNNVHLEWVVENENPERREGFSKHCNVDYEVFKWIGKWNKTYQRIFNEVMDSEKLKVFTFNIDCFISTKRQELLKEILVKNKCLLVIDESQDIKNVDSKRTKFFMGGAKDLAKYKRILTGTPITKGTENIYSQFYFLDPGIIGLNSYFAFKMRYCKLLKGKRHFVKNGEMKTREYTEIIGYKNIEELQQKIKAYSYRVLKKDCLDLPEKIYQSAYYSLSKKQAEAYQEIANEAIAIINSDIKNEAPKEVLIKNAMSKLIKLQQVTNGYLLNLDHEGDFFEIVPPEKNPKLLMLEERTKSIESKVIIWTCFKPDVNYIMDMFDEEIVRYDGNVSQEEKSINKERFKRDDKIKYIVVNLKSGSKGLNLQEGKNTFYYSNTYNLEYRLQSEDRSHRIGIDESPLYTDFIGRGTMDKKIIKNLIDKKQISDLILQEKSRFFDFENE